MKTNGLISLLIGLSLLLGVGCGASKSGVPQETASEKTDDDTTDDDTTDDDDDTSTPCTKDCVTLPPAGTFITYRGEVILKNIKTQASLGTALWQTFLEDQMVCKKEPIKWWQAPRYPGERVDCDDISGRILRFDINGSFMMVNLIVSPNGYNLMQVPITNRATLSLINNSTGFASNVAGRQGTFAGFNKNLKVTISKQSLDQPTIKIRLRYGTQGAEQDFGYINAFRQN